MPLQYFLSQCKRPDRDDFVTLVPGHLAVECEKQFEKAKVFPDRLQSKGLYLNYLYFIDRDIHINANAYTQSLNGKYCLTIDNKM